MVRIISNTHLGTMLWTAALLWELLFFSVLGAGLLCKVDTVIPILQLEKTRIYIKQAFAQWHKPVRVSARI